MKRIILVVSLSLLLTCLFPIQSYSQVCQSPDFNPAVNYNVNHSPVSVAVGDFNGDGNSDIAVVNSSKNVSLLLGDGKGNFGSAVDLNVGNYPTSITTGDINGDGYPDLVTISSTINNATISFGDGKGNFNPGLSFSVGRYPTAVAIGNFNHKKTSDLVVANYNLPVVSVLLKDSLGGFNAAKNYNVTGRSTDVTVGDFNKDGNDDIAVANALTNNVSVLLGDGNGNFGLATNFGVGVYPTSITTGDFNKDGNLDIATANYYSNNVSVLLGDGSGKFSPGVSLNLGTHPWSIASGDINNDKNPDLVVTDYDSNKVSVILGDGAGKFGSPSNFVTGTKPMSIAIGDLNNDGSSDIIVANFDSNNLSVLLNACTAQVNQVPVAKCQNVTVSAGSNCQADVGAEQVDNGSYDPDGDELTFRLSPAGPYPVGVTDVSLIVNDGQDSSTCLAKITVIDHTKPVLVAISNPIKLWPPNHRYEKINVNQLLISVTSHCNSITNDDVYIASVSSDESENEGNGDGNTINDIIISQDCKSVYLRKERQGTGNGRVYTITLVAIDNIGNSDSTNCFVTVPLSNDGNPAVDDGPIYTVSSSCGGLFAASATTKMKNKNDVYQLEQNFPNPFNPSTRISYVVLQPGHVKLTIYNILGEEVATLVDKFVETGNYEVSFDASGLASGLYLCKLQYDDHFQIRKMILTK